MVEGLKLTLTGEQLIAKLNERIRFHTTALATQSKLLRRRTGENESSAAKRRIQREIAETENRIETLAFVRDHIEIDETYRLGEYDLRFADLLPEDPCFVCDGLREMNDAEDEEEATVTAN